MKITEIADDIRKVKSKKEWTLILTVTVANGGSGSSVSLYDPDSQKVATWSYGSDYYDGTRQCSKTATLNKEGTYTFKGDSNHSWNFKSFKLPDNADGDVIKISVSVTKTLDPGGLQ